MECILLFLSCFKNLPTRVQITTVEFTPFTYISYAHEFVTQYLFYLTVIISLAVYSSVKRELKGAQ